MVKLIHDIKPTEVAKDVSDVPAYLRGYGSTSKNLQQLKSEVMVAELWRRGYTIEQIFSEYYALNEIAYHNDDLIFGSSEEGLHGRPMTVGDAELAGTIPPLPPTPSERQPF